jgi:hypothetical protein
MKIEFNEDNPLVINWEDTKEKPMLRDDCRGKVLFCVYKLGKGFFNRTSYGNTYYGSGYYVIPVFLSAHRWFSGNKVVMSLPSGIFGSFSMKPIVHGVEKKDYEAAENFRHYYGICKNWPLGYDYVTMNTELYDNVQEAIDSAKHHNSCGPGRDKRCHCGTILHKRDRANNYEGDENKDENVYICPECGSYVFF